MTAGEVLKLWDELKREGWTDEKIDGSGLKPFPKGD